MSEVSQRTRDIAFYERRAKEDPTGALDLAQVAGLYLQRARETGDHDDLHRAEAAARRSLANSRARNGRAAAVLANALLGQHRFAEAYTVAAELCTLEPEVVAYLALRAEIEMELGRYDDARTSFALLSGARDDLRVAPRLARWEELQGNVDAAGRILERAASDAAAQTGLPREQVAWFHLRLAELRTRSGDFDAAARALESALELEPHDHRALAARSRLLLLRGDAPAALADAQRALALVPDSATLAAVYDAAAALGDSARAAGCARALQRRAAEEHADFNRVWSLFCLDHERQIPETLERLRREVEIRPDVQGSDLLAWALYRNGDAAGARAAMAQALRLGTREPLLLYHAGMIEQACGDEAAARRLLQRALDANPRFHPVFAPAARDLLAGRTTAGLARR